MSATLVSLLLAMASKVALGPLDEDGCAHGVVLDGKKLGGGPSKLCIREALLVNFDDEPMIALQVDAPHRFEPRVRSRVFIYRVLDGRLVPRFLGSGFSSREVTSLFVLDGALGLKTLTPTRETELLRCGFDGFPLVCSALPK